jgi:two-component system, sensor histidine kinase and response regulator
MFGYSADEMVGQKVELLLPATLRESHVAIRDGFIHSATGGAPPVVSGRELVAAHRDGHDIPVEVSLNPMGSGSQLRVIAALRDISERKAMQRALREREQAYSSLISTIPGTVYRCRLDADWTMLFMNDAVAELTGYPASDFIGNTVRSYASIIHPEDIAGVDEEINGAVQAGRSFATEYRIVHASGELRHVFETGRAEPDESGSINMLAGTLIDITDRVAAQEQQQESERRLLLIADAAELGLWEYFFKEDRFVTNVNFTSLMGYHPAQLRQSSEVWSPLREGLNTIVGLMHPDDLKVAEKASLDCLYGRSDIFRCEYRQRCADGQWRWFLDVGQVVERDADGRMLRIAGVRINHHVEKLLAEELLAARDAAQAAAVVKANFLANMSHEIRTPMNAIMGLTQLALRTDLDARQRNYLEKIDLSSNNLLTIINDILDFSKIEAGKLSVETLQFSLDDVFEGVAGTIGLMASEKDIELLFRLTSELPKNLRGDPLRLGQVLVNLCSNAVKFTESGGEVVAAVAVEERTDERVILHFSVADTGIGMTAEQQENLFQAFSQADASTTRKYGGTGLGLAICKNLVQLMGGRIWSESELGQGSIFHFSLPFGISSQPLTAAPAQKALPEALRVLVVDDNASARDVFTQFLVAFGYEVAEAQSGEQALALLEGSLAKDKFDLVLMDWKMGALDGLETIRRLAASTASAELPKFIVVSAFSREDVRAAATDLEIAAFLTKPVTPSSLLDAIAVATNGNEVVSRATRGLSGDMEDALSSLRGARILVVEDNAINQEVICELLATHDIEVEVADNGQLAIAKLKRGYFDGILMDCQMPVMDGYEATRAIRTMPGYAALPIIAMTANVMAGDRDKALAAGMNDHVGKPIDIAVLFATMARWISTAGREAGAESPPVQRPASPLPSSAADSSLPGIDMATGLRRFQGNEGLYHRILRKFEQSNRQFQDTVRASVAVGDWQTAQREAHTLKGLAGTVGADALAAVAAQLESACGADAPDEAAVMESLEALAGELEPVLEGIAHFFAGADQSAGAQPEVNSAALGDSLRRLRALLADDDSQAGNCLRDIESTLSTADPLLSRQLQQTVDAYDYPAALVVVDSWLARL